MDIGNAMEVVACDFPKSSVLHGGVAKSAYFRDSYSAPIRNTDANVVGIFFAIFGHHPNWMKLVLVFRNNVAMLFGLKTAKSSDVLNPLIKEQYAVGEKIGPWPIYHLTQNELVAGRDNKHLDFRLSVLKSTETIGAKVVVSTVCDVHNMFGKVYLFFVVPFHKWGVKKIIKNAVAEGRL